MRVHQEPQSYFKKYLKFVEAEHEARANAAAAEMRDTKFSMSLSYETWCTLEEAVRAGKLRIPGFSTAMAAVHHAWNTRNVHFGDFEED